MSVTLVALSVQTRGRKRPVASAKPATVPVGIGGRPVADRVRRAAGAQAEREVAGPQAEAERGGHVVAGARADDGTGLGPLAGGLERAEHRRQRGVPVDPVVDEVEQVDPVAAPRAGDQ